MFFQYGPLLKHLVSHYRKKICGVLAALVCRTTKSLLVPDHQRIQVWNISREGHRRTVPSPYDVKGCAPKLRVGHIKQANILVELSLCFLGLAQFVFQVGSTREGVAGAQPSFKAV